MRGALSRGPLKTLWNTGYGLKRSHEPLALFYRCDMRLRAIMHK